MAEATAFRPPQVRELVLVAETDAHEGPVYVPGEDALYFTSVRRGTRVAIRRLELASGRVTTVREDSNVANGMTLDLDGRLLVCEQGTMSAPARIGRLDPRSGAVETVVDGLEGRRLNSPNDVAVRRDGTIWFTDPSYGHLQGFRPEPETGDHVYRFDPRSRRLSVAADGFDKPNGLAFSPDESILYVSDNGAPHELVAFEVLQGGELGVRRPVALSTPGHPDGLKVDAEGRIYGTAADGIRIWAPDGEPLGAIELPGAVNFAFGGLERNVLFITTDTAVWAARLNTKGA